MTRDDRIKSGFKLKGRTDAEIEAMAQDEPRRAFGPRFVSDDVNPVEVVERLVRTLRAARNEGVLGSAAGRRTERSW